MKTIVVGLGNPILGDDGVGWRVAEEVKQQLPPASSVDIDHLSLGGLSLMEHLIGYERAILIDALQSTEQPGSVVVVKLDELQNVSALHTSSAHDTSLQNALNLGRAMGVRLPQEVIVVGITTGSVFDFSEELSPPVAAAVSKATEVVINLV